MSVILIARLEKKKKTEVRKVESVLFFFKVMKGRLSTDPELKWFLLHC